ncbi:MAG TPA: extracellular solute-binding protein [Anaerolineales bacterium]|nr:extracellular solute-binding protein [Anaerolineales bacterium]
MPGTAVNHKSFDTHSQAARTLALLVIVCFTLGACTGPNMANIQATTSPGPYRAPFLPTPSIESPPDLSDLIAAAQAEGRLVTMALPNDWCNYGEILRNFKMEYGIDVQILSPYASSGDELDAIRSFRDLETGDAPDVVDIGHAFGPQAQAEGLLSPYKVSNWASIPFSLKDPDGYWYGGYYGVLAFEVNTNFVVQPPQDWADLLRPEYHQQVALAGDPRSSSQAILSVYAAGLSSGGTLENAVPGLEFFSTLHTRGNLVPIIANVEQVISGETPIVIRWDYLALGDRDANPNAQIEIILPKSGILGGLYVQAISAYAQHPNAARLWMEYLYSDKGQILWLKGYCHPIRFNDLMARQVIPSNLIGLLPPAEFYNQAVFPTLDQQNAAQLLISTQWDTNVGVDITRP